MKKLSDSKLEIDRLAYFKSISKLSLAELNNKSHGWSILQHLYHCWLVESLAKQYCMISHVLTQCLEHIYDA